MGDVHEFEEKWSILTQAFAVCYNPLWRCGLPHDSLEDEKMLEDIISIFDDKTSPEEKNLDPVAEGFEELVGAAKELVSEKTCLDDGLHVPWDLFLRLEELGFDARNRSGHVIGREWSGKQILRRADLAGPTAIPGSPPSVLQKKEMDHSLSTSTKCSSEVPAPLQRMLSGSYSIASGPKKWDNNKENHCPNPQKPSSNRRLWRSTATELREFGGGCAFSVATSPASRMGVDSMSFLDVGAETELNGAENLPRNKELRRSNNSKYSTLLNTRMEKFTKVVKKLRNNLVHLGGMMTHKLSEKAKGSGSTSEKCKQK